MKNGASAVDPVHLAGLALVQDYLMSRDRTGVFLREGAGHATKVIEPNTKGCGVSMAGVSTLQVNEATNLHSIVTSLSIDFALRKSFPKKDWRSNPQFLTAQCRNWGRSLLLESPSKGHFGSCFSVRTLLSIAGMSITLFNIKKMHQHPSSVFFEPLYDGRNPISNSCFSYFLYTNHLPVYVTFIAPWKCKENKKETSPQESVVPGEHPAVWFL